MKLHKFKIEGFGRIKNATIQLGDATFLIGANNAGITPAIKQVSYAAA
jgi:predicted ATP-dependent endonuclease of OLD family